MSKVQMRRALVMNKLCILIEALETCLTEGSSVGRLRLLGLIVKAAYEMVDLESEAKEKL